MHFQEIFCNVVVYLLRISAFFNVVMQLNASSPRNIKVCWMFCICVSSSVRQRIQLKMRESSTPCSTGNASK